jgi:hypothetical protein
MFIWSDSDGYERATATDGVTAWTWIEPENGLQGWAVFVSDSLIGAGQVNTAARRAAAKEIEDRKKVESPAPAAKPAEQPRLKTEAKRQPEARTAAPQFAESPHPPAVTPAPSGPPRLGLSDLKAAAQARRAQLVAAE